MPIQAYAPLELVHVDFTRIETKIGAESATNHQMSWLSQTIHKILHDICYQKSKGKNCRMDLV